MFSIAAVIITAVCAFNEGAGTEQCYDTQYESTTLIHCDDYSWGRQPYPWEWSRGLLIMGYRDSASGEFIENRRFNYVWGAWWVQSGNMIQYNVGIDDSLISGSSFEGECYEIETQP